MNSATRKAVVLLSGGMDSTVCLSWAKSQGYGVFALSVDYGQRHRVELQRAQQIAAKMTVQDYRVLTLDLRCIGGSALTSSLAVPKNRTTTQMNEAIPVTYVPARNTILLATALGYAESVEADTIIFGANKLDYHGYPDCRPAFFSAFSTLANVATKRGVECQALSILTPLIDMTKADIIRLGVKLGVDLALTTSCYDPDDEGHACGACDACLLRQQGFRDAGVPDPTRYRIQAVHGDVS